MEIIKPTRDTKGSNPTQHRDIKGNNPTHPIDSKGGNPTPPILHNCKRYYWVWSSSVNKFSTERYNFLMFKVCQPK